MAGIYKMMDSFGEYFSGFRRVMFSRIL